MENVLRRNNHLFVAYAAPKKIAENSDFIRLLGQKPKLANIFAGFLAYYLRRAKKLPRDRNCKSYQTLDLGMNLFSGCPERHDKAIRNHKKSCQIAMSRRANSHIYCPQQIRAMNACFGLTQGDIESEYDTVPLFFLLCLFYSFLFSN